MHEGLVGESADIASRAASRVRRKRCTTENISLADEPSVAPGRTRIDPCSYCTLRRIPRLGGQFCATQRMLSRDLAALRTRMILFIGAGRLQDLLLETLAGRGRRQRRRRGAPRWRRWSRGGGHGRRLQDSEGGRRRSAQQESCGNDPDRRHRHRAAGDRSRSEPPRLLRHPSAKAVRRHPQPVPDVQLAVRGLGGGGGGQGGGRGGAGAGDAGPGVCG